MEGIESKHRARKNQRNPWGRHREASTEQEKNKKIHGGGIGKQAQSKKKPKKSMGEA